MKDLLRQAVRSSVHRALAPTERRLLARYRTLQHPAVFILGAPRSGTSLFYELLVTRYHFAYFSNLAHRFFLTPSAATVAGRRLVNGYQARYRSDYGHIAGWGAPNEGGWIWQRWLEDGPWKDESALSQVTGAAQMSAVLAAHEAVLRAPFVNKNVMHANRVRLLDALFPDCVFIEVRRDMADTARSIIRAQQRHKGPELDPDAWWSVRPSAAAPGDLITRAALQVTGVAADISRDTDHIGRNRLCCVEYAGFCADPEASLQQVATFLRGHGLPVAEKGAVPGRFELNRSAPLEGAAEGRLQEALNV